MVGLSLFHIIAITYNALPTAPLYPRSPERQSGLEVVRYIDLGTVALRGWLDRNLSALTQCFREYLERPGIEMTWTVFAPVPPHHVLYHSILGVAPDGSSLPLWEWKPGGPRPAGWVECQFIEGLAYRSTNQERILLLDYYARRYRQIQGRDAEVMVFLESSAELPPGRPLEKYLKSAVLCRIPIQPSP